LPVVLIVVIDAGLVLAAVVTAVIAAGAVIVPAIVVAAVVAAVIVPAVVIVVGRRRDDVAAVVALVAIDDAVPVGVQVGLAATAGSGGGLERIGGAAVEAIVRPSWSRPGSLTPHRTGGTVLFWSSGQRRGIGVSRSRVEVEARSRRSQLDLLKSPGQLSQPSGMRPGPRRRGNQKSLTAAQAGVRCNCCTRHDLVAVAVGRAASA